MSDEQEIIAEDGEEGAVDKVKKVKEQLKHCQKEKSEYLTGWQRCQADFINYKRRQEEQTADMAKLLCSGLIKDLLPILDSLEPRNYAEQDSEKRGKEMTDGLKMIQEQLMKVLQKHGLAEIKAVGEKFDPELHEAVETVESKDGDENTVVEEVQKGYMLNGKVARVSKVKVIKSLSH